MKNKAFSLVELLVVMGIITVLAALTFPTLSATKKRVKTFQAKNDVSNLSISIGSYEHLYGIPPIGKDSLQMAGLLKSDFTFGNDVVGFSPNIDNIVYNSEVMAIIMDLEVFLNGDYTVNKNHARNPQRHNFFNGKLDNNGIFRDPWETPYIITLDANFDDKCRDSFYSKTNISAPNLNGLIKTTTDGLDFYEYNGKVMAWSFGADKKINFNIAANKGENKDNVLSWSK